VLRNLSQDMCRSETLGLTGQSGFGKGSLALAIHRLLHLDSGEQRGESRH